MKNWSVICLILALCNIGNAQVSLDQIQKLMAIGKSGWSLYNELFFSTKNSAPKPKRPTAILMRYNYMSKKGKAKSRNKFIAFDSKVDNPIGDGPFDGLIKEAQKLSRKKEDELDISEDCELIYYEERNNKKLPISIMDDSDLLILMGKNGDEDDNTRVLDIICEDTDENRNEIAQKPVAIQKALFAKNKKAFNHVVAIQTSNTKDETEDAVTKLNQAGISGFAIDAKGIAILDIEKDAFKSKTDDLATEWEWDGKIKSTLGIVTVSGKQFSGGLNVEFDAANWQIKGQYARFAGFKTVENKYSIYVATAKFEYTIPRKEREGNTLDTLGITSGGSIKGEYFEKIKVLMEGKALERFAVDVVKPDQDDYAIHNEL